MAEIRYFVVFERDDPPIPWDPHDPTDLPLPDCAYFGGVFRTFEREWDGGPLTVYLTKDPQILPSYGDDVIVVLLNEEWFRTTAYSGEVLAVLRNLAGKPWFSWSTLAPPSASALVALVNYLRILAERTLYQRQSRRIVRAKGWRKMTDRNTIDVPLGYFRQPDLAIRPYEQRGTDAYFGGSLIHDVGRGKRWKRMLKGAFGNPKQLYRRSMVENAERFAEQSPEANVKVTVSGDFRELESSEVTSYADDMMDARVALVPRGTAPESYRLFEAWRYGCIAVCEEQPPRWFYEGAPYVMVRRWKELGGLLGDLFGDDARQRSLHEASLRWWREVCSEEAVGQRVVSEVKALRGEASSRSSRSAPAVRSGL